MEFLNFLGVFMLIAFVVTLPAFYVRRKLITSGLYEWFERSHSEFSFYFKGLRVVALLVVIIGGAQLTSELFYAVAFPLFLILNIGGNDAAGFHRQDKESQAILFRIMPFEKHTEFLNGFGSKPEMFFADDKQLYIFKHDCVLTIYWDEVVSIETCHKGWFIFRIINQKGMVVHFNDELPNFLDIRDKLLDLFPEISEDWKQKTKDAKGNWITLVNN